ncbi:unnamed protein product [Pseudo-nitzschia multistriata]|uniref:Uncharacterized protein n=1 Tax=Pseudo-nitzschia multistriata TaxID=183589 RepID=A0A448ZJR7_9STRA|nr:unnamed protein product [Pseudo-nitzschia multistriata]
MRSHPTMVALDAQNADPKGADELVAAAERNALHAVPGTAKRPGGTSSRRDEQSAAGTSGASQNDSGGDAPSPVSGCSDDGEAGLVLAFSSLVEGSDFGAGDGDDARDDGTHPRKTSGKAELHSHQNADGFKRQRLPMISSNETTPIPTGTPSAKKILPPRRDGIRYAQLFFDPETKTLVTLMEVASNSVPCACGTHDARSHHWYMRQQKGYRRRGTPLHRSSLLPPKDCGGGSAATRGRIQNDGDEARISHPPCPDTTLPTECSSMSSEASDIDEEDRGFRGWGPGRVLSRAVEPTRYPGEPIVFSNDERTDRELSWSEEPEIDLYLLRDCDDAWDYGATRDSRCTDSLKKLLSASRSCISLPQIGESRWRASAGSNGAECFHNSNHHKTEGERPFYLALNE